MTKEPSRHSRSKALFLCTAIIAMKYKEWRELYDQHSDHNSRHYIPDYMQLRKGIDCSFHCQVCEIAYNEYAYQYGGLRWQTTHGPAWWAWDKDLLKFCETFEKNLKIQNFRI